MLTTSDILRALKLQKRLLMSGALCGLLSALIYLFLLTPQYTAAMVVGPVSQQTLVAMGAPLATAALPNPAASDDTLTDFDRYLQLLTASNTAAHVIDTVPDILPTLFADEWDSQTKKWRTPFGIADIYDRFMAFMMRHPRTAAPDAARLADYVRGHLIITPISNTKMRAVSLRNADRGFAISLLYALHKSADGVLREEAVRRSDAITGYINQQLPHVQLAEHRLVLSQLLAAQERIHILAAVNLPFAADIIEEPNAADLPDWPQPWPILILGTLLGVLVAASYITYRISRMRR